MSETPDYRVLHQFYTDARKNLSDETWDYIVGGAETETTLKRNRLAIDSLALRPRVLRDVSDVQTKSVVLGQELRLPVILAPVGSLQDITAGGAAESTLAAAEFGALHMLSSSSVPGLEDVAAAVDYPKIYQLYVRGDQAWLDDRVARAIASGYIALCLTVDLDYYGRRERDLAKAYTPTARKRDIGEEHQERFSWSDIERIRSKFDIPIILKGIADPRDAKIAVEHDVAGIYVSNHGGRQLDQGPGSLSVLPEIVDAVGGQAEIFVDGGFMRGTDIIKAIALGANAVGIGRLQCYALGAAGAKGAVLMLEILEDEIIRALGMLGITSLAELDPSFVEKADPVGLFGTEAGFPLLREDY